MKVTAVRKKRKLLTEIVFGEESLLIDSEVFALSGIKVGSELSREEMKELSRNSELKRAKSRAMWYLTGSDLSRRALSDKLRRSFSPEITAAAVERMCELGLVNDRKYAERLADSLLYEKCVAPRMALHQMMQKGVDRDLAREVLDGKTVEASAAIGELIERKYSSQLGNEKDVRRTFNALLRRGFSYSEVREAMRDYIEKQENYGD